jgi:hypothetical protein
MPQCPYCLSCWQTSHFAEGCVEAAKKVRRGLLNLSVSAGGCVMRMGGHGTLKLAYVICHLNPSFHDVTVFLAHELGGPAGGDGVRLLHRLALLGAHVQHGQLPGRRQRPLLIALYVKNGGSGALTRVCIGHKLQIEHHLFPSVSAERLRPLVPVVKVRHDTYTRAGAVHIAQQQSLYAS